MRIGLLSLAFFIIHLVNNRVYSQYYLLGEGQVKIESSSAVNILPSYKFYPGDKIRLVVSQGSVRHNWRVETEKDCFLGFIDCEEKKTPINNEKRPSDLPVNIFLIKSDGQPLDKDGYPLWNEEKVIPISTTYPFAGYFQLKGFFGDYPLKLFKDGIYIDRTHSDGSYTIQVFLDATNRIAKFKEEITKRGNDLTYAEINNPDFLNSSLKQFYKSDIALTLTQHCNNFPAMDKDEKKSLLQMATELDPINPVVNLAMSNAYLLDNDLTNSEREAKEAIRKIRQGSNNPFELGQAFTIMGQINNLKGVGFRAEKAHEAASCFAQASEAFLSANEYEQAVKVLLLQAEAMRTINTIESLEASSRILEKAYSIQTETIQFSKNKKYGLMDLFGQEVLPAEFDSIKNVSGAFLPVLKNRKWGYINKLGSRIFDKQFDNAWGFNNGIARIYNDNAFGYIDNKGTALFGETFKWASDFYNNLAIIETSERKFYFMNYKGNKFATIAACTIQNSFGTFVAGCTEQNADLSKIEENLKINNSVSKNLIQQFFNRFNIQENKEIIAYNKNGEPFSFGAPTSDFGFIDKNMNIRVEANGKFWNITPNGKNFIASTGSQQQSELHYLDSNLVEIQMPRQTSKWWVNPQPNGYFVFNMDGQLKFGLIDRKGNKILDPTFDQIQGLFNAQYFYTRTGNSQQLRRGDGTVLYQVSQQEQVSFYKTFPINPEVNDPTVEYFIIALPGNSGIRVGIVNNKGELIIPTDYDEIILLDANEGTFLVTNNHLSGVFQIGKGLIVQIEWQLIRYSWPNRTYTVIKNDKIGLLDFNGNEILAPEFTGITYVKDTLVALEKSENWKLYSLSGKEIIQKPCKRILPVTIFGQQKITSLMPFMVENSNERVPFLTRRLEENLSECVIFMDESNKYGLINTGGQVLVNPIYDTLYSDKAHLIGMIKTGSQSHYTIMDFTGLPIIPDKLKIYSYNPYINTIDGVTNDGLYKLADATNGHILLTAVLRYTGNFDEAIEKENFDFTDIKIFSENGLVNIPGIFDEFLNEGRIYYLVGKNEIWQFDPITGYKKKISVDKIYLRTFIQNLN